MDKANQGFARALDCAQLFGANVANCKGVSKEGIQELARSSMLRKLTFSADKLSQADVLPVIDGLNKNIKHVEVVDVQGKLDSSILKRAGTKRQIKVLIQRKGVLQRFGLDQTN